MLISLSLSTFIYTYFPDTSITSIGTFQTFPCAKDGVAYNMLIYSLSDVVQTCV